MENTISIPDEMFENRSNANVTRTTKLTLDGCRFVVDDLVERIQRRTRKMYYWPHSTPYSPDNSGLAGIFDQLTNGCISAHIFKAGSFDAFAFNFLDGVFHSVSVWQESDFGYIEEELIQTKIPTCTLDLKDLGNLSLHFLDDIARVIITRTAGGIEPKIAGNYCLARMLYTYDNYALHYADMTEQEAGKRLRENIFVVEEIDMYYPDDEQSNNHY